MPQTCLFGISKLSRWQILLKHSKRSSASAILPGHEINPHFTRPPHPRARWSVRRLKYGSYIIFSWEKTICKPATALFRWDHSCTSFPITQTHPLIANFIFRHTWWQSGFSPKLCINTSSVMSQLSHISDGGEITSRDCSPRFSKIATDKSTETRASRERTDNGWCSKKWNKMYGLRARSCTISSYHWGDDDMPSLIFFPPTPAAPPSRAK